jgi:hypothetical protein
MKIISRKDALNKSLSRYFTGKPCIKKHVVERYTSDGKCVSCVVLTSQKSWKRIKDKKNILDQTTNPKIKNILNEIKEAKLFNKPFDRLTDKLTKLRDEQIKITAANWRKNNKEYVSKKNKIRHKENMLVEEYRKENVARAQKWYFENKEKKFAYDKKRREENPQRMRDNRNKWKKKHWTIKSEYMIKEILSKRVRNALNAVYVKKVARTKNLVGCEISFLRQYIANKFKKGMSWDNYGEWEIDHIRPCSSYNLKDPEHQLECFNYSNLQPLWKKENRKKSDKY